ncbi:MAG: ribonuclease H-like domain-containing protein [Candidatus Omnitrophota bacterium]
MIPKNTMVLDLETQRSFKDFSKSKNQTLDKLKISVVGVYDYQDQMYRTFEEKEVMKLEQRLKEIDLLIGFNIRRFDLPVLAPYLFIPTEKLPVLDLLEDVETARGHRASLDSIAKATLHQQKSGSGKDALALFQAGRMEELKKYCLDDVRLTKEIFEYGVREQKVFFTSTWDYQTYEIPVRWQEAVREAQQRAEQNSRTFPSSLF